MKILLDTHILIWIMEDSKKLSKQAKLTINNATEIYVSVASLWEMAIKINLGKLRLDLEVMKKMIEQNNFIELPILFNHVITLKKLPDFHKDPFDRILIAQAISEPLKFITHDISLKKYSELIEII